MYAEGLIETISSQYGLDRAAAVQTMIALAGVLISVSASIAAAISAWATFRSVREMKAARMQQARPAIMPKQTTSYKWKWIREENDHAFLVGDKAHKGDIGPILKNIGFGTAFDIEFSIGETPFHTPRELNYENLCRLFHATELRPLRANNGIEVQDPLATAIQSRRLLAVMLESRSILPSLQVAGEEIASISPFFIDAFLAQALSNFEDRSFSWHWPMKISYRSLIGESFERSFILNLLSGPLYFKLAAPIGERDGIPNWSEVGFDLNVSCHEVSRPPSIFSVMVSAVSGLMRKATSPLGARASAAEQWMREVITGDRKSRKFKIGDQVIFAPFKEWVLIDDPSVPFETSSLKEFSGEGFQASGGS